MLHLLKCSQVKFKSDPQTAKFVYIFGCANHTKRPSIQRSPNKADAYGWEGGYLIQLLHLAGG